MKKKFLACIMVLAIAVAFMPANTFAASKTATMKAYDQVIKSGNTVYCAGAEGLYKVKVKKGKVVSKKVISRATGMSQEKFLLRNGADVVVFPERDLANETAIRASSSSVSDYMNLEGEYAIFEIRVPESWYGKTVASLNIRNVYRVNVLGIRKDGVMNMHVTGDTVMEKGASVMVLGKEAEIFKSFHLAE